MRPVTVFCICCVAALGSGALRAQTPAASPTAAFDVVSIKPSDPDSSDPRRMIPMLMPPMNGRFTATNAPLRVLIRLAYQLLDYQIVGGPSWQLSKKFDIQAKVEDAPKGQLPKAQLMIQNLLADRFKLKVHRETREMPVSSLVLARSDGKLGRSLQPFTGTCPDPRIVSEKMKELLAKGNPQSALSQMSDINPCSTMPAMLPGPPRTMVLRTTGQPMSMLALSLTQTTGRLVQDHTGLTGLYSWQLISDPQFALQNAAQMGVTLPAGVALPPSDAPSLFTYMQEELGLKIVTEHGPVDVLVIDSAELPTPD